MSAFSTVGDVFAEPEFLAPSNSLLWGLGALEDSKRERTGFLSMLKRPYEWYVHAHGCHKFNSADLALGPRETTAHFPVFSTSTHHQLPGPCQHHAQRRRQKRLERKATKHERRQCRRKLTQPSAS